MDRLGIDPAELLQHEKAEVTVLSATGERLEFSKLAFTPGAGVFHLDAVNQFSMTVTQSPFRSDD